LRYNRQERGNFFEISIKEVLEDLGFEPQIDGLWMRNLFLVLWNILDGNYAVAVFRNFPSVVITLVIRLVYPGRNYRL
jgi:hypothetical protein